MHELAVTQSILEIAVRHGQQAQATRVTDLYLVIGQLSSFVDESVQFFWDNISQGTIAAGATLHFRRIPATLQCQQCGHEFQLDGQSYRCPKCTSKKVSVTAGEEFYVEAMDIE